MLGIHGIGPDKADYYLSDLALELPVAGPGRWLGSAAAGLGLTGTVRADQFARVLEGRQPQSGVLLGSGRASVGAFDLTFSAPKSVSVLFALAGADVAGAVVAAHGRAVAGSLSYLERHGITATRRSGPDRVVLPTGGAVAAAFTHGVSRNGDPHLHSHVVVANLVHGVDGRWGACDRRGLDAHRQATSAVYEAHLRAGLTVTLGARWTASPGRSSEVAGVGTELLAEFSTRGADIRRHMHEHGAHSARGARVAWAATRPVKAPCPPFADLVAHWRQRAQAVGGDLQLETGRSPGGPDLLDEHRYAGVISLPAHGGAHRRDVVAAFGSAARNGAERRDARTTRRAMGSVRTTRSGRTAPTTPRGRAGEPPTARSGSQAGRSRRPRGVGGCRPHAGRVPAEVGSHAHAGAIRSGDPLAEPGVPAGRSAGRSRPHRAGGGGGTGPARMARDPDGGAWARALNRSVSARARRARWG